MVSLSETSSNVKTILVLCFRADKMHSAWGKRAGYGTVYLTRNYSAIINLFYDFALLKILLDPGLNSRLLLNASVGRCECSAVHWQSRLILLLFGLLFLVYNCTSAPLIFKC
ncbi:hypothetical protein XENOCAPTIV_025449 [Xenoophorus captivus]|uniref:Uncharacterized protein n=1 Tax=Xenoophorus captivus TaxID=1517983 RepID=A0ABV0QC86_9TELE